MYVVLCWSQQRRFPDFSYISDSGRPLHEFIDCVIIRLVVLCTETFHILDAL